MQWLSRALARRESSRSRERQLAEALRIIASATSSGRSLPMALHDVAARTSGVVSRRAAQAAAQIEIGVATDRAVATFAGSVGGPSARLFADVMRIQHRRGGDLAHLCHRLAGLLHDRARLHDEARSLTAQARFTARAVVVLPALVALGWAVLSPESMHRAVTPAMFAIVSPALLMMAIGVVVVRKLARASLDQDYGRGHQAADSRLDRVLVRVAGQGSRGSQSLRLAVAALLAFMLLAAAGGVSNVLVIAAMTAIGCGVVWPHARSSAFRRRQRQVVQAGLPTMLEASIALLAAGAAPREVIVGAIEAAPSDLRQLLRPALAQVSIGRSAISALASLEPVRQSPELDGWMHALTTGERYGTPLLATLDTLLRDARAAERERFRTRASTIGPRMQLATVLLIVPSIMWIVLAATTQGLLHQLSVAGVLTQ